MDMKKSLPFLRKIYFNRKTNNSLLCFKEAGNRIVVNEEKLSQWLNSNRKPE